METVDVIIVGAGPSGLVLGALLGRMGIKVVILEKELEVCEDPRGIVVNGDAVRISYQVGIGEGLTKKIGSDIGSLNFHAGDFRKPSFMNFDLTRDWAEQSVSQNITQFQPNYEREIRLLLKDIPTCEIRAGCEVIARSETERQTIVEYYDSKGEMRSIQAPWLVGADGKRGVVRKRFLEPEGIKQVDAVWPYIGTWIAVNLEVDLPTPDTHPDFPLWELGYTPEKVHEAFWPKGFHFCNDPIRPAVSGRFGPQGARFWRHEYSIGNLEEPKDPEQDFWDQFQSWMSLPGAQFSHRLKGTTVVYPKDCIKVLRCRPFRFATKVVNRWFYRQTILIGDAAHVFPPFGGQGIATGIRDAQALGWRLAMMTRLGLGESTCEHILKGWSQERRHAWEAATLSTKLNGSIANLDFGWRAAIYRLCMRLVWFLPGGAWYRTQRAFRDKLVYTQKSCPDGFFLQSACGGRKIGQIWIHRSSSDVPQLCDEVFMRERSHLSVVVIVKKPSDFDLEAVPGVMKELEIPSDIITYSDVSYLNLTGQQIQDGGSGKLWQPSSHETLEMNGIVPIVGYNKDAIQERLHSSAKYIILRPDFFIYSVASNLEGLKSHMELVKNYFDIC